jgi:hypothetical protein
MPTFPGTNIPTGEGSCDRMNHLIDDLMTPRIMAFRQICFYDVPMRLCPDKETWKAPFGEWLDGFCHEINFNGCTMEVTDPDVTDYNAEDGSFKITTTEIGPDGRERDVVEASFQFDYFPVEVLEAFLNASIEVINAGAFGPPTDFKVCGSAPPAYWDGVLVDLAFAMSMEKLLLDYNLWKHRLVFAVGPNEVEGGGGDIVGQLEMLKQNAEERAYRALDNELFKIGGHYVSPPTAIYFDAIRGYGGSTSGAHGIPFSTGRLRGWKPNRWPTG